MTLTLTPAAFRERFALATFPDGGVVVDLETGSYSRLNAAGAVVLEELERAEGIEGAIEAIGRRLGVEGSVARGHLGVMTAGLAGEGVRREPTDPFRYRPAPEGGYDVWQNSIRVLHVDEGGDLLTLIAEPQNLPLPLYDYVSGLAPKLLFLRGVTVLHGSSCLEGKSLLAICGKSRAGKTTTARTLAKHGRTLVSEDLLLFGPGQSSPHVFVDGEKRVDQWARDGARVLAGRSTIDTEGLAAAATGATLPLGALWFLDAARRGDRFDRRRLGRPDALGSVMANHFLGARAASNWRRYLEFSRAIALAVPAYELAMPNGLDRLDEAIRSYTENSAS